MAAKLDRNRPFGEIQGEHPCRFMQDGKWFQAQGLECDESGKLVKGAPTGKAPLDPATVAKATASNKAAKAKAAADDPPADPADDQLAAQLAGGEEGGNEDPLQ
jgi:hypothetical protein